MNEVIQFIIRHGYPLAFVSVLADQIGVPVPASPMLLAGAAIAAKRSPPSAPSRGRVQGVESKGLSGNYRKGHRAESVDQGKKQFQASGNKLRAVGKKDPLESQIRLLPLKFPSPPSPRLTAS